MHTIYMPCHANAQLIIEEHVISAGPTDYIIILRVRYFVQ